MISLHLVRNLIFLEASKWSGWQNYSAECLLCVLFRIVQKSSQGIYCSKMGVHVFCVHRAVLLCFSVWWEEWLVWLMYWVCRTCTHHPWFCHSEVHRSLASMHYDWWGEMLNFDLHFICKTMIFFFCRNSVIHSMCKNTWYFCQSTRMCVYYFYWYLGKQIRICICLTGQERKEKWSGNHPILTAQTAICNSVLNYHCR